MRGSGLCAGNIGGEGRACGETQVCLLYAILMFLPHQKPLKGEKMHSSGDKPGFQFCLCYTSCLRIGNIYLIFQKNHLSLEKNLLTPLA